MNNAGLAAHRFWDRPAYLLLPLAPVPGARFSRRGRRELSCLDNGGEFRSQAVRSTLDRLNARHTLIKAGRPRSNGHVEALHRTILEEYWRPAFGRYLHMRFRGLRRELETHLVYYNFDRVHHGQLTQGSIPADVVYGARKMELRCA